jgi:hypothetical protein
MIDKAIVSVDAQAFVAAEELPNEIKRRFPDATNISTERASPDRSERLRADGPSNNLIIHRRLLSC